MAYVDLAKKKANVKKTHRARRERVAKVITSYKEAHGCKRCGFGDVRALDLHHTNPDTKIRRISPKNGRLRAWTILKEMQSWSEEKVLSELNSGNFEVLCANCHKIVHAEMDVLDG